MRAAINEIENRPTTEKNNETKNWFFVKELYDWQPSIKTDKKKKKREMIQITNIRN